MSRKRETYTRLTYISRNGRKSYPTVSWCLVTSLLNGDSFWWHIKIYTNKGNMTAGADGQTIDAMSLDRINRIIDSLKDEKYVPNPARRTYIPKKNGKLRPSEYHQLMTSWYRKQWKWYSKQSTMITLRTPHMVSDLAREALVHRGISSETHPVDCPSFLRYTVSQVDVPESCLHEFRCGHLTSVPTWASRPIGRIANGGRISGVRSTEKSVYNVLALSTAERGVDQQMKIWCLKGLGATPN